MELKKGYKQTEVGVIPDDWKVKRLGELGVFKKGKGIKKNQVLGDGIPCVRYGEIYTHHNNIVRTFNSFISENIASQSQKLAKGDLLFAGSGETADEIGKCVAFLDDFEAYAGGDVIILMPYDFDSRFFGYLINFGVVALQKSKMGQGDAVVHIYPKNLAEIYTPLPPRPEQGAIAGALNNVDALLTAIDALIAKKRLVKQGAMQELLTGNRRLSGFSGEWKSRTIDEMFQFLNAANNSRSHLTTSGTINYIHYGDIHTKWKTFLDCDKEVMPFIDEDRVQNISLLEEGDLVMADASEDYSGIGVSVEIKNISNRKIVAGLHTLLLRGNTELLADGFKGYLQYIPSFKNSLIKIAVGISVYGISKNNVKGISVLLPDVPEQQAIAEILGDMDAEILSLETRREKTRLLKQGMMQELLTGRIRLL